MSRRRLEYMPLSAIRPARRNPKGHDQDGLIRSVTTFGFTTPVLLDERTQRLVAGHGRLDTLTALRDDGADPPTGIVVGDDGAWLVPVVRGWASANDAEADALVIADNRLTETGGWDGAGLAELLSELAGESPDLLAVTGYTTEDLDELIASALAGSEPPATRGDPDDVPDLPAAEPVSATGDLWRLAEHRLLVGDAADPAVHTRLLDGARVDAILTDPPYGMRLDTDWSSAKGSLKSIGRARGTSGNTYEHVIGDHEDYDPRPVRDLYPHVREQWWFGADYYAERLPDKNDGSWLVWDKRKDTQADAIGSEFELCWSATKHKRRMLRHDWFGFLASGDNAADARRRLHPTQKPVTLIEDILNQWTTRGAVILDPYAGSGTTLIAAHRTGRRAYCVELDRRYADVICARWQAHTGDKPVCARTGEPTDFLARQP